MINRARITLVTFLLTAQIFGSAAHAQDRAVNVNGPTVTVDGVLFEGTPVRNVRVTGGTPQPDFNGELVPPVSGELGTVLRTTNLGTRQTVSFLRRRRGLYDVTVYVRGTATGETVRLFINNRATTTYALAGDSSWQAVGPFRTRVRPTRRGGMFGSLRIRLQGLANLAGAVVDQFLPPVPTVDPNAPSPGVGRRPTRTPTPTRTPRRTAGPTPAVTATPGATATAGPTAVPTVAPTATPTIVGRFYFVAPNGNDASSGVEASPLRTLQRAADRAEAGDVVRVRAGSYLGFTLPRSGTSNAPIVFRADAGAVITQPVVVAGSRYGIFGTQREFITIEGFTFQPLVNTGFWFSAVRLGGLAADRDLGISVRNNTVSLRASDASDPDRFGIFVAAVDGADITGNTITGTFDSGIYVTNSSRNVTVSRNTLRNLSGNGIRLNGDLSGGAPGIIQSTVLDSNSIVNSGFAVSGGSAILFDGVQDSRIQNTLVVQSHDRGITLLRGDSADASLRNVIVNNTVLVSSDGMFPLRLTAGTRGNIIFNNIFLSATASRAWINTATGATTAMRSDFNVTTGVEFVDGVARDSWESSFGFDVNSIVETATNLFIDPAAENFHLRPLSVAVDAGTQGLTADTSQRAPAFDFEGDGRPSGLGFDIGYDETN